MSITRVIFINSSDEGVGSLKLIWRLFSLLLRQRWELLIALMELALLKHLWQSVLSTYIHIYGISLSVSNLCVMLWYATLQYACLFINYQFSYSLNSSIFTYFTNCKWQRKGYYNKRTSWLLYLISHFFYSSDLPS